MTTKRSIRHEGISADPSVLVGKPVVKGTRISVELILEHLADNPDVVELFAAYPELTIEDVKAALAYARDVIEGDTVDPSPRRVRARPAHPGV